MFSPDAVNEALVCAFYASARKIRLAANDQDEPMTKYERLGIAAEVEAVAQALADAHWHEAGSDASGWQETAFNFIIASRALAAFVPGEVAPLASDETEVAPAPKKRGGKPKLVEADAHADEPVVE